MLFETVRSGHAKDILFIRYEDLCQNPQHEMQRIYQYLQIPQFAHDFSNIRQVTQEDDRFHGVFADHAIRSTLTPAEPCARTVLGKQICDLIVEKNNWHFNYYKYNK